jgi:predicted Zn-dependent peptidase
MRWNDASNWWFGAQVRPENVPRLYAIIEREIIGLQQGHISDEDLINAKQFALGRHQRSAQTVAGTANGYSTRYFFDDIIEDYYEIPKRIEAVQRATIPAVSQALFEENVKGFGVLGTCGKQFAQESFERLNSLWK